MDDIQHTFPSTIEDDDKLAENRRRAFKEDKKWREEHEDFERAAELYEAKSGDTDEKGIPRMNYVRRAVEDYVAVAVQNTPKARLRADRHAEGSLTKVERDVRLEAIEESEEVINAYVRNLLRENDWPDHRRKALKQSGIYGVGYIKVDVDRSADARYSYAIRDLFQKGYENWTPADARKYKALSMRFDVSHVDSRNVFWQSGVRSVDQNMYRVSTIERRATKALREMYDNEDISHGKEPFGVEEDPDGNSGITAILTTWELEPITTEIILSDEEGNQLRKDAMTDWKMVKTVVAGGELIDKEVWTSAEGSVRLPIVPFYLRESEEHPYGYSIPLMLEGHQDWLNYMQTAAMKSAKNSTSTQGVFVFQQNLGPGDEEEVDRVLEEGGVGKLKGNDLSGAQSIQDIAMPLNYNGSQINPAMIEAIQMGQNNLQMQSQTVDHQAVSRARTGSAKRTEINMGDRAKTLSLELISSGTEGVYDCLFELIRTHKGAEESVRVERPEGESQAVLNQAYERQVPEMDEAGNPVMGEDGEPKTRTVSLTLNDTSLDMKAQSEGRGSLPIDTVSKFQLLTMLVNEKDENTGEGLISHETVRELVLPEEVKSIDDRLRAKSKDWKTNLANILRQHPEEASAFLQQAMGAAQDGGGQERSSTMPDRQAEQREMEAEMQAREGMGGPVA